MKIYVRIWELTLFVIPLVLGAPLKFPAAVPAQGAVLCHLWPGGFSHVLSCKRHTRKVCLSRTDSSLVCDCLYLQIPTQQSLATIRRFGRYYTHILGLFLSVILKRLGFFSKFQSSLPAKISALATSSFRRCDSVAIAVATEDGQPLPRMPKATVVSWFS